MEAISLPNLAKVADLGNNKYIVTLEPLYPGYGVTVGNAMRRVLLSSLPGSAATAVKIKFVDHEFSTIPNVVEDVVQIILNLKQLRLKSFSPEPVRLILRAKGQRKVTAGDIKETDQVQVVNKNLHIATLDNKNAELDMELVVEQGRGYLPVEARENQKLDLGMIAIDAIFTPVKSVHFDVSNVRVGHLTNFDKLELVMETDGSVSGQEATDIAAHILVDHFTMLFSADFAKIDSVAAEIEEKDNVSPADSGKKNEIAESTLSTRAKNALIKNGVVSLAQLRELDNEQIENLDGLGDKSIKEILDFLGR